jgi:hypothetical protein
LNCGLIYVLYPLKPILQELLKEFFLAMYTRHLLDTSLSELDTAEFVLEYPVLVDAED